MLRFSDRKNLWLFVTLLAGLMMPVTAFAAPFAWNGSVSNDWFEANNWTPPGVPGGGDDVTIAFGTADIGATSVSIAALNLSGGSVSGTTGKLTLTGASTFTGGGLAGTIINNGTVTWPATAGNINALPNVNFTNNGTFNAAANATWAAISGGTGQQFNNVGTLNANRPANSAGFPQFGGGANFKNASAGTVHAITNNLGISDGTSSGTFNCDANAFVLFNANTHTLTGGAKFTGAGKSLITGTVSLSGSIVGGQSGGTLELSGGHLTSVVSGGTVTGVLSLAGGGISGIINANGTTNWTAVAGNINALPNLNFTNNGTFNAAANATWAAISGGTGQQFNNIGTLNANRPATSNGFPQFGGGANFKNASAGTVHAISNNLGISDGTSSGTFNCDANAFVLFNANSHTLTGGAKFTGAGKSLITGTVSLNGSIVGGQSGGTLELSGGHLTSVVGGGTITGTLSLAGGGISGIINANGTTNWIALAGNINALPNLNFTNNGTFNAAANATWAAISGGTGQQFNNVGTLNANRPATSAGFPQFGGGANFKNTGTVHAITNNLGISDGTSSGTFNCDANAFVLFNASSHTLTGGAKFTGAGKSLITGTVSLNGSIVGGQSGGTLELSGGHLTTIAGGGTVTGVLSLAGGGISGTINANGTTNWIALAGNINALPNLNFTNNGTFNAAANATWAAISGGTGQQFNNVGTLNANRPATSAGFPQFGGGANFKNTGTVHAISNNLGISDGTSSGTFNCDANAFVVFNGNTHTLTGSAKCTGAGSTRIQTAVTISGSIVGGQNGGKLELFGGTLTSAATGTITGTLLLSGGAVSGTLNANGTTNWPAGASNINALNGSIFNNNGTFNAAANATWAAISGGTGQQFNNKGALRIDKPHIPGIVIPFTQTSAGTLNIDLNGINIGSGYDQIRLRTPITLGGALNVALTFTPVIGTTFTIINNDGGNAITGTFAGLPQDALFAANGVNLQISYTGGDGNDVTLTRLAPPTISISDVIIAEGTGANKNANFTVSLSAPSPQTVSVNAITANGTAKSPADYTGGGATLTFTTGQTSKTFSVPVIGDTLDEDAENFFALLSSPVNASVLRGRGVCTINDNDATPSITIEDVNIGEGNGGQRTAVFRLHLSAPSGRLVKVNYATAAGTTNPAAAGVDYVAVTPTQIAFTTGQTITLARVLINGDTLNENDETFKVNLSGALNATIADAQAIGTILNDDPAPSISIDDVNVTEGNPPSNGAPGTKNMTFTLTLTRPSAKAINVNYTTANGSARSDSDYGATNGTLVFAANQTSRTLNVVINGDTIVEGNETLFVLLSNAVNASIGRARGVGTITNDDSSP